MDLRTKYDRKEVFTNHGSTIKKIYGSEYDKQHRLIVVEKAQENLKAYINSFAESVDINVILNRFRNGDKQSLLDRAGVYLDISEIPDNMNDLIKVQKAAESYFDTLPVDIKEKFNNNVTEFISQLGSKEVHEMLSTSEHEIMKEKDNITKEVTKKNQDIVNHAPVLNPGSDITDPIEPIEKESKGVTK